MNETGTGESIDVLVIIAHGKQGKPLVGVVQRSPGDGGDQCVFFGSDVLVFVDQDPAIALDQRLALRFGLGPAEALAVDQVHRLAQQGVEVLRFVARAGKACPHQSHCKRVAGEDGHPGGVIPDQMAQPGTDFGRCMAVVGENKDTVRVFAPPPEDARCHGAGYCGR